MSFLPLRQIHSTSPTTHQRHEFADYMAKGGSTCNTNWILVGAYAIKVGSYSDLVYLLKLSLPLLLLSQCLWVRTEDKSYNTYTHSLLGLDTWTNRDCQKWNFNTNKANAWLLLGDPRWELVHFEIGEILVPKKCLSQLLFFFFFMNEPNLFIYKFMNIFHECFFVYIANKLKYFMDF